MTCRLSFSRLYFHFLDCPFTFLIMSFNAHKFLILMKLIHLFFNAVAFAHVKYNAFKPKVIFWLFKAPLLFAFVIIFPCSDSGTVVLHLRRKQPPSEQSCSCIGDYYKVLDSQTLSLFMVTPFEPWWEPCWLFKAEPPCGLLGEKLLVKISRRQRLERLKEKDSTCHCWLWRWRRMSQGIGSAFWKPRTAPANSMLGNQDRSPIAT